MADASSEAVIARFLALHPKKIDLSLDRMLRLLEALGAPHRATPPVIHVAGTNGKGSTIAFMRAALEADGRLVHVYTSPHLVRFEERVRLGAAGGGRLVSEPAFVAALERCERANAGQPITVFEITTAAAFLLFAENPADALLLEVGLGGRLDATNVIDRPIATIVTSIGLDHAEYLGDTVEAIAREKAGIFKPSAPAIVSRQDYPMAEMALRAEAERRAARLALGGQDFSTHEENGRFVYQDEDGLIDLPLPRLAGRHQHLNAGAAIAALRQCGLPAPSDAALERAMTGADWPGRMQRLTRGHLVAVAPAGAELWLDGGHNADGGRVVSAAMAELEEKAPRPLILIVGMLGAKDSAAFLKHFAGLARAVVAVPIQNQAAARPAKEIAAIAREVGLDARIAESVTAALDGLSQRAWPTPPRILITGSLYLAGEVLSLNGAEPT